MRRLVGVLVAVLLLSSVVTVVAIPAVGGAASSSAQTNQSVTGDGEFDHSELSETGTQIQGQDPSSRYLGQYGMVFVSYAETNFIKELSKLNDPEWTVDKVVSPDSTVDTQEVTMHVTRYRDAPTKTATVHVVQWDEERVEVSEGNTTRTETIAANQTHRTHEVELTGASDEFTVSLPHTDSERQVTMWIEAGGGQSARWVYSHDPVATTNATPFDAQWSSFFPWFLTRFFLVLAVGIPLAIGGGVKTLGTTYTGPGKGAAWWIIVPGILAYIAGYLALGRIAELLVTAPWAMGLALVAMAYVATLEYADQTYSLLIEQVTTVEAENALGEGVRDIEGEQGAVFSAVDLDGNRVALVKEGSLKLFLLVALTDAEWPILDLSDMKSRIEYGLGTTEGGKVADAKLYADEDDDLDEVIDVQWPSLSIGLSNLKVSRGGDHWDDLQPAVERVDDDRPEIIGDGWSKDKVTSAFLAWGVGTVAASGVFGAGAKAAAVGLVPLAYVASDVTSGSVSFKPAPEHATKAKASRTAEQHELTVAQTFEEMQQTEADREADVAEVAVNIADARTKQSRERLRRLLGFPDPNETDGESTSSSTGTAAADGGTPDAGGGS